MKSNSLVRQQFLETHAELEEWPECPPGDRIYGRVKYADITPNQLDDLAEAIAAHAGDQDFEREEIEELAGWDRVGGLRALVRQLRARAKRLRAEVTR